jgi:hypothetical protein
MSRDAAGWTPLRWPCGPLELERARRREGSTAREVEALRAWGEPRALESLATGPVDCLVVTWAEGSAEDDSQQRALAPLVEAARRRGLAVVGWVGEKADLGRAIGSARAGGLAAVATESRAAAADVFVLRFRERGLGDRSPADFVGVAGGVWPGLRIEQRRDADASSGPTGPPWLDSNAWHVRLVRDLLGAKVVWLAFEPPEIGQPLPAAAYVQAIADSAAWGGRYLVALDPHLRLALAEGRAAAHEAWAELTRALALFAAHRGWAELPPVAQLGVVSGFGGADALLAFEALNLLSRLGVLYRIVEKERGAAAQLDGLDAVLYVDQGAPAPELAHRLDAFVEAGGTLVAPPGWPVHGTKEDAPWAMPFRVFRHGRGRLAVAREEIADPFLLAESTQSLMGHRHDRLRAFNPGTTQLHYAASADSRTGVLHAMRYQAPDHRLPMSVWLRRAWASARALGVDGSAAVVAPVPRDGGVEIELPPVPVYCALELSS